MQASTKVTQRTALAASGREVTILAFSGDISSASKEAILGAYQALDGAAGEVLLNFTGVEYINSSGIAIIIQVLLEAQKVGSRSIGIFGLSSHFQKVFTMVGIAKYAALYPDERASLAVL
jgi:anti-sigma B factor antagonist